MQVPVKRIGAVSSGMGASMRTWQIIVASAVAASIAAAALFIPEAARSPAGVASLLPTYWPGLTIVWITVYAIAALVLSTAAAARDIDDAEPGPGGMADGMTGGMDWARRYLLRLGITQYFSAVLALLALGLLPLAIATEPFFRIPAAIGPSPALTACAVTILVGIIGWIIVTVAAAFRPSPVWTAPSAGLDTQLLREIIDLLRARPAEPDAAAAAAAAELAEQLRHRDHATLEAIRELAGAVSRVRAGISEIQHGLQRRGPEPADQSGSAALADIAGELRATTAALGSAVARLEDVAAGLAAVAPLGLAPPARSSLPPGSRSQLTTELQELLRDMAAPAPHGEEPR